MEKIQSSDEFLDKLKKALQRDGDFPASAKIVVELRKLVEDPKTTASKVTEVILREPSLGTRILSLVNSSYYRRVKPIMTVSQAVVQLGVKPIAELCAGLVLLQKFVPQAKRNSSFAECFRKTILTSLIANSISPHVFDDKQDVKGGETGYLAGTFAEIGILLLAYYFPNLYENAIKRCETKGIEIKRAIKEIVGLSPVELSIEVIKALGLPQFYVDVLKELESGELRKSDEKLPILKEQVKNIGKSVCGAEIISEAMSNSKSKAELDSAIHEAQKVLGIDTTKLIKVVASTPTLLKEHCESLQITLPDLPEYVSSYTATEAGNLESAAQGVSERFSSFVDEIKASVEAREPTASIVTTVMEACAWGLNFDRVFLLIAGTGKQKLHGRMLLGNVESFNPKSFERSLGPDANPLMPEVKAFREGKPVFSGSPLLPGGSPIAVIPIGVGKRAVGVIYADRVNPVGSRSQLSEDEKRGLTLLSDLLDRSITLSSRV